MSGVRVLVYHASGDPDGIEAAYHQVSKRLQGVPGLLADELLRSVHDPTGFVVMSTWRSLADFQAWEGGSEHREATAPLRPFRTTGVNSPFGVYEVVATYRRP